MAEAGRLKLGSDIVGSRCDLGAREITWRATTNYAAALGDLNPRYFDDTGGKTLIAPPMYAVAFTWPVLSASGGVSAIPPEIAATAVHASEHLTFHRPIRVGERLAIRGQLCSIQPTRAGVSAAVHVDLVDPRGEVVVSEYQGTMYRGVSCADPGRTIKDFPITPEADPHGSAVREVTIPVRRELPYVYDGCSDIVFPIHTSPAFATEAAGLPDIILQGTCSLALAAREIVDAEAAGEPARLCELACRFSRYVIPGTEVRLQILERRRVGKGLGVLFRLLDRSGEEALTNGYAAIAD